MSHAFTFGKYLPFHRGHEALIAFALGRAASLTVLVCASDRESISGAMRRAWIEETFAGHATADRLEVRTLDYTEAELPNTSVASEGISRLWAVRFRAEVPEADLVVTSEPYGALVAAAMSIDFLDFDPDRKEVPVSATDLRRDVFAHWAYLPPVVRRDLVTKVVVLGTESTGKSTLCAALAAHFDATLVAEAGRELIPDSRSFTLADLGAVVKRHTERVAEASAGERGLLIVDTDVHTTVSYARYSLGEELVVGASVREAQRADLYLYLRADVPHVQDGTRLGREDRDALDGSHRAVLAEAGVAYAELTGDWAARWAQARDAVAELVARRRCLEVRG